MSDKVKSAVSYLELVPVIVKFSAIAPISQLLASYGLESIGFNMFAALLRAEDVEALSDVSGVIRIFYNDVKHIPELPEYSSVGVQTGNSLLARIRSVKPSAQEFTDTYTTSQMIGADQAWSKGITGKVPVGVIDSDSGGSVLAHPQIRFTSAATYDIKVGFHGATNGHGTHVGTTIGGKELRISYIASAHVVGVAWGCRLMFFKSLITPMGMGMDSDIIKGISMAVQMGARVLNMSLGGKPSGPPEDDPICDAIIHLPRNVIACIASGNDGAHEVGSPAYSPNALAINALDPKTMEKADFSNYGPESAFIMPGVNIFSGIATGSMLDILGKGPPLYSVLSGTSQATPHAAGMIALYTEYFGQLNYSLSIDDIKKIGENYGDPRTDERGYGMLKWEYAELYASELSLT